eukprot:TRINITY_DN37670_c0_g1_i1.p1 TRINITY_DN37670_c0_g1~~TRINITY_DN37670_c0_g1_i1.p1  ORF type:complete len:587 (-),score=114.41 TRINITY_DN37670_c0_g1_i1:47-1774(-)
MSSPDAADPETPGATAPLPAAKRRRREERVPCDGGRSEAAEDGAVRSITLACSPSVPAKLLRCMRDIPELCDVTLCVFDGAGARVRLRAHRLVLAAASSELRAMLLGGFRECSQEEITLDSVPAWAAQALLEFVYTGRVTVRAETLLEMARVADYVGMLDLREMCVAHAVSALEVGNAAEMLAAADAMGLVDLREKTLRRVLNEYSKVTQTDGFTRLSDALLQEILQRDDLRVRREEEVFDGFMRWLRVDAGTRITAAERLLPLIRFPRMNPQYLIARVEQEELLKNCSCLPELLREAKNFMLLTLSSSPVIPSASGSTSQRTQPRADFGDVLLEGRQPGEPQAECMGVYEVLDRVVNGRFVYQQQCETDLQLYLYYTTNEKWYVSDAEDMLAGRPRGWCQVTSQAQTPDKIREVWTVWDAASRTWDVAPHVHCRAVNDAARREVAARRQLQEAEVRRRAQQVGDIVIEGQEYGELVHDCMGTYEVQDQVVNGRPVYRQRASTDVFLFYASRGSKWCISDGEDMCAGRPKGWCYVVSQALTPDLITEQWEVVADDNGPEAYWQPAPRFRVRRRAL